MRYEHIGDLAVVTGEENCRSGEAVVDGASLLRQVVSWHQGDSSPEDLFQAFRRHFLNDRENERGGEVSKVNMGSLQAYVMLRIWFRGSPSDYQTDWSSHAIFR